MSQCCHALEGFIAVLRETVCIRTRLKNAPKSPWRHCGSAQNAHPAAAGLRAATRLAENLYLIDRSEVPPSGGALNPDSHS